MTIETTELAEIDAQVTLFGTDDPIEVIARASRMAQGLADVIRRRHLYATIGPKDHVTVEGWTLCGSMLGVFAHVEWSRPLPDGWEARAMARLLDGRELGAVDAQCTRSEYRWRDADDYAIRSMAQTRAISKALRGPLGFVVELAGYAATPAEELDAPRFEQKTQGGSQRLDALREEIDAAASVRGIDREQLTGIALAAGVRERATLKQLRSILATVESYPLKEEAIDGDDDDSAPVADDES